MCHVTDYYIKPCLLPWGGTTHSLITTVLVIISVGHQLHTNLHYNLLLGDKFTSAACSAAEICCLRNRIRWPVTWRTKRLCVQKPCTAPDYAEIQPNVKKMPHLTLQEKHTQADIYGISNHNRAPQQPKHTERQSIQAVTHPSQGSWLHASLRGVGALSCVAAAVPLQRLHDTESCNSCPSVRGGRRPDFNINLQPRQRMKNL